MTERFLNVMGLLLVVISMVSTSCSDDDEKKKSGGYFEFNGENVSLSKGAVIYDEHRENDDAEGEIIHYDNVLVLYSDGLEIVDDADFVTDDEREDDEDEDEDDDSEGKDLKGDGDVILLYVTSPIQSIAEGTYAFGESEEDEGVFELRDFVVLVKVYSDKYDDSTIMMLSEGEMVVKKSGGKYSITFNGIATLKGDGEVEDQDVPVSFKYAGELDVFED